MQQYGRPVYGHQSPKWAHSMPGAPPASLDQPARPVFVDQKYDPRSLHFAQRAASTQQRVDTPNLSLPPQSRKGHSRNASKSQDTPPQSSYGALEERYEMGANSPVTAVYDSTPSSGPLASPQSPAELDVGVPSYATAVPIRSASLRRLAPAHGQEARSTNVPRTLPLPEYSYDQKRRSSQTDPRYLPSPPIVRQAPPVPAAETIPKTPTTPVAPIRNEPAQIDQKLLSAPRARRRSSDDHKHTTAASFLQVAIPSYRLGVPRVGERGTIYLRESIYNPLSEFDEHRVSELSESRLADAFPAPPGRDTISPYLTVRSSSLFLTPSLTPIPSPIHVDQDVYNAFINDSDDSKYIVYLPGGRVLAATPARLIAQVTHARFLDYDLLSDFFLTYRSFMRSQDLLKYLVARLRWSVSSNDAGRVVRVRVFVALRHWILNYFMDDFENDEPLRVLFCDLVNSLANDLYRRPDHGSGDLQVVRELKKCWRRTCDVVFETNYASKDFHATDDIYPGAKMVDHNEQVATHDFQPLHQTPPHESLALPRFGIDPVDLASIVTSPVGPWKLRQNSMHATSCAIPMWNPLSRSQPSFRPRSIIAQPNKPVQAISAISRLPSVIHRHKKSKSSKGSIETVLLGMGQGDLPVAFDPKHDLGPFQSGDLIRGILVPPPVVEITKHYYKVAQSIPFEDAITSPQKPNMVESMLRRLQNRDDYYTASFSHQRPAQTQKIKSPELTRVTKSDRLTAKVADEYQKLLAGIPFASPTADAAVQQEAQPMYAGVSDGRNNASAAPTQPNTRLNSHMTSSSRSIMIINDIHNDDPAAFDLQALRQNSVKGARSQPSRSTLHSRQTSQTGGERSRSNTVKAAAGLPFRFPSAAVSARSDSPTRGLGLAIQNVGEASRSSSTAYAPALHSGVHSRSGLRRVPGGNLRAADHVEDLSRARRNSTGSISADRISPSSTMMSSGKDDPMRDTWRLDGTPRKSRRTSLQLINTRSSAPDLRGSFKVERERLASISGTGDLDGGIESTLAILEGRLASPTTSSGNVSPENESLAAPVNSPVASLTPKPLQPEPRAKPRTRVQILGHPDHPDTSRLNLDEPMLSPVLEIDVSRSSQVSTYPPNLHASDPFAVGSARTTDLRVVNDDRHGSIIAPTPRKSDSLTKKNWPLMDLVANETRGSSRMSSSTPKGSFFLDDDEFLSEDEKDDKENTGTTSGGHHSFFLDEDDIPVEIPPYPFYDPPMSPPPTTPLPPVPQSPPPLHDPMPQKAARRLRTPGPEDTVRQREVKPVDQDTDRHMVTSGYFADHIPTTPVDSAMLLSKPFAQDPITPAPAPPPDVDQSHTPFILSYSSSVLATQLAVIERDALSEIDWKDLVEQRWSTSPTPVHNWAEYMRQPHQTGVDIVTARFNLTVKWAVSEILLTTDIHDRARTVSKLIHIATHARRIRNYATMYQLTVALLSTAISRLSRTWTLVPQPEKDQLSELETLVQPARNFARLRAEMDSALVAPGLAQSSPFTADTAAHTRSVSAHSALSGFSASSAGDDNDVFVRAAEGACIPFIGLYTHDLVANAGKPAFVDDAFVPVTQTRQQDKATDSSPRAGQQTTTTMVNFERFQSTAALVKGMLRMLEASQRYTIRANRAMIARCLWLAALDEAEIEARSRALEIEV